MADRKVVVTGKRSWLPSTSGGFHITWYCLPVLDFTPTARIPWKREVASAKDIWCLFASGRGVEFWREQDWEEGLAGRVHCGAVGSSTAQRLEELGAHVEFVGDGKGSESFLKQFLALEKGADWPVVVIGAEGGRTTLAEGLKEAGRVTVVRRIYASAPRAQWPEEALPRIKSADAVVFTSPSSAKAFLEKVEWKGVSIALGAFTAQALREHSLDPHVLSSPDLSEVGKFLKGKP